MEKVEVQFLGVGRIGFSEEISFQRLSKGRQNRCQLDRMGYRVQEDRGSAGEVLKGNMVGSNAGTRKQEVLGEAEWKVW